jgi:hypothetical protein
VVQHGGHTAVGHGTSFNIEAIVQWTHTLVLPAHAAALRQSRPRLGTRVFSIRNGGRGGGLEETTHKELRHGNTAWSGGFSESSPTMRLTTRVKESPRPGVDKDIRGRRHAISPRSAKVRVVRDAPRQSGHRRTAPVSVRVFLILRRHSSWILRRTQRKSARGLSDRHRIHSAVR